MSASICRCRATPHGATSQSAGQMLSFETLLAKTAPVSDAGAALSVAEFARNAKQFGDARYYLIREEQAHLEAHRCQDERQRRKAEARRRAMERTRHKRKKRVQ